MKNRLVSKIYTINSSAYSVIYNGIVIFKCNVYFNKKINQILYNDQK